MSFDETAERFGVGRTSVIWWSKQREAKNRRNKSARKMDTEKLKEDVEKEPDAYPYERAERFGVSQTGICAALKRLGYAAFHKRADIRQLIEGVGHLLEYRPPDSPDLNPIKHQWVQVQAIRKQKKNIFVFFSYL